MEHLIASLEEVRRLLSAAQAQGIHLRLIGGLAVMAHSPHADHFGLRRAYPDIDFVIRRGEQQRLGKFFETNGYLPEKTFNLLNGERRQIYYHRHDGLRIDVFIGDFEMCHRLPLKNRLHVDPLTVPLAELFLSKTQIIELNHKDIVDLVALLLDNEVIAGSDQAINSTRIAWLCARDWGLYTTTCLTLSKVEQALHGDELTLSQADRLLVQQRLNALRQALSQARKGVRWRARARLGTRLRWYAEVEEVERA